MGEGSELSPLPPNLPSSVVVEGSGIGPRWTGRSRARHRSCSCWSKTSSHHRRRRSCSGSSMVGAPPLVPSPGTRPRPGLRAGQEGQVEDLGGLTPLPKHLRPLLTLTPSHVHSPPRPRSTPWPYAPTRAPSQTHPPNPERAEEGEEGAGSPHVGASTVDDVLYVGLSAAVHVAARDDSGDVPFVLAGPPPRSCVLLANLRKYIPHPRSLPSPRKPLLPETPSRTTLLSRLPLVPRPDFLQLPPRCSSPFPSDGS